ncbi:Cation efflux system protein CusC precursor [Thiorhodovibrio winogradskyi]|uniref:Cation efflux system protein CusC n=1 Tax=Thiorhodovibrio winogradskyi TaxID=77007 RepID=A0ABZ0SFM2_9GAMM|nr:TolC family protein [Thiorhodovibrio winogradskyi]
MLLHGARLLGHPHPLGRPMAGYQGAWVARVVLLVLLVALLAGCAIKRPRYDTPDIPLSDGYTNPLFSAGTAWDPKPKTAALAFWWRLFDNEDLNRLIDRAIANDPDLRIASQRVMQALARSSQAKGGRLPEVSLPARYEYESPDGGAGSRARGEDLVTRETYQIGLRGDWRVDLWGELESLADSADYALWRAVFDYDERLRQLSSDVVRAFVDYLVLNDRMRVAAETEKVLDNMLAGMLKRLESGDATVIDVDQQRTAVKGVQTDMPAIALEQVRVKNRLVALVGALPASVSLPSYGLSLLDKPRVKPGIPAALLLQRPDVRAVEAGLLAADADIDVARARVLPPLDLTAEAGFGSEFIEEVFMPHTVFYRFIGNLSATVFDAGRRKREVDYSRAVYEELLETYVKVIYGAGIEVENALATIEQTRQRFKLQQEATNAARRAWTNSQEAYLGGAIDYLTWLDTARTYHRNLDNLHIFSGDNYRGYADLFSSLGGGAPLRAPLPGDGRRPTLELASILSGDTPPLTTTILWPPSDGWYENKPSRAQAGTGRTAGRTEVREWLVHLSGIHTREGLEATWRDLLTRFPELVDGKALLALNPIPTLKPEGRAATWYRLAVEVFPAQQQAESWCLRLRGEQTRCDVRAYDQSDVVVGRFPWPDPLLLPSADDQNTK